MPIDKLVPTANATDAGGFLATNNYTLIDETYASQDGSINNSIADDSTAAGTATWSSVSNLSSSPSSVNSATFRVYARVIRPGGTDDAITYTIRCTVGGTNYDITYNQAENAFAVKTAAVGTGFTEAQYNAATFSVFSSGYSKTKGPDALQLEIDTIELEVDYNGATVVSGAGSSDGTSTVAGVSGATKGAVGAADGTSTVAGTSGAIKGADATADGTSTVSGVGAVVVPSVATSDGTSTVAGVGADASGGGTPVSAAATSDGTSTVAGVSGAIKGAVASTDITLVYDSFTDTVGTDLTAHTPDTNLGGNPWVNVTNPVEINASNQATSSLQSSTTIIDTGEADVVITADVQFADIAAVEWVALCARITDVNNFYKVFFERTNGSNSGNLFINKKVAGVGQIIGPGIVYGTVLPNTTYKLTFSVQGNQLYASVDGLFSVSATDSDITGVTKHGLQLRDPGESWMDNFTIKRPFPGSFVSGRSGAIKGADATSDGTSTVAGVGGATKGADATSDGTSTVAGTSGATKGAVATSDGVATVAGVGEDAAGAGTPVSAAATSDGTSTVAGVSGAIKGADATADGTSTVAGVGGATKGADAASDGVASVSGVSGATKGADATSDGVATVAGVGADASGPGTPVAAVATSDGTSSVAGVSGAIKGADATSDGVAVVAGDSATVKVTVAVSDGTSTVAGDSATIKTTVANADGTSSVSGVAAYFYASVAMSFGVANVSGVSGATKGAQANSDGFAVVSGVGADGAFIPPDPETLEVGGTITLQIDASGNVNEQINATGNVLTRFDA